MAEHINWRRRLRNERFSPSGVKRSCNPLRSPSISYRIDSYRHGNLHIPQDMMNILTLGNLANVVKKIVKHNKNFAIFCSGRRQFPKTKLADVLQEHYCDPLIVDFYTETEKGEEIDREGIFKLTHTSSFDDHYLHFEETTEMEKIKQMEEKMKSLEETNKELSKSLDDSRQELLQSQAAANQWNLLQQSVDTIQLKKLLDHAVQSQLQMEKEVTKKTNDYLDKVNQSKLMASAAREKANNIQKLMEAVQPPAVDVRIRQVVVKTMVNGDNEE